MATDTGTATADARRWSFVFWLTAIASAIPILAVRYQPFADMPEHVAAIATLGRMMSGDASTGYVVDFARSQYLLYHAIGGALTVVVRDAVIANQLLLAAVAVLWPVSVRALLRATSRDDRLAIFASMVFYNRALAIGFLPYLASVPLALFALAALARGRKIAVAVLAVLLFYMHVSSYVLFCAIALAWTALDLRAPRAIAKRLVVLVPSGIAALAWWRTGSIAGDHVPGAEDVGRMNVVRSLNALPVWTFDMWRGHVDELCGAIWWLAFGIATFFALRTPDRRRSTLLLLVPVACAAALYLATPFRVGFASMLNVRLAPLVTLFAILPLSVPKGRSGSAALALAAIASVLTSANTTLEGRRASREMVGDLDALLAKAAPGSRLVMLNYERSSPRTHFWPYVFAGSYHRARGGAVASWSFCELPHWPLHYARDAAPPTHGPFWVFDPDAYRPDEDGRYYDYALVQGDKDPFTGAAGPRFSKIASSGAFTLYGKVNEAPAPSR